jgi:hypothetical protein
MSRKEYEQVNYVACVNDTEVIINYTKNGSLHVYVAPPHINECDNWETYHIRLTRNTRKLPEFKRFNNEIRARIATGIHICSELPNYNLPFELAQNYKPNPWWKQRGEVPTT